MSLEIHFLNSFSISALLSQTKIIFPILRRGLPSSRRMHTEKFMSTHFKKNFQKNKKKTYIKNPVIVKNTFYLFSSFFKDNYIIKNVWSYKEYQSINQNINLDDLLNNLQKIWPRKKHLKYQEEIALHLLAACNYSIDTIISFIHNIQ